MGTLLGLAQFEARTAGNDVHAVLDEVIYQVFEVQQHRTTLDQGDAIDSKARLQGGELV